MEAAILVYDQSPIDSFFHVVEDGPFNPGESPLTPVTPESPRTSLQQDPNLEPQQ